MLTQTSLDYLNNQLLAQTYCLERAADCNSLRAKMVFTFHGYHHLTCHLYGTVEIRVEVGKGTITLSDSSRKNEAPNAPVEVQTFSQVLAYILKRYW